MTRSSDSNSNKPLASIPQEDFEPGETRQPIEEEGSAEEVVSQTASAESTSQHPKRQRGSDSSEQSPHPLIELRNVTVQFGRQTVLRNISLSIPAGQTLAVIGESGCGKSVLMKTIIGLIRPTEGYVFFDGQDISQLSEKELARQRIRFGYVFQTAALFDSMTVGQNVAFPLRQHADLSPAQIDEVVSARLAEVGIPKVALHKRPAELSGGMRKRVGLARALVLNPEVVLYDEPTTGLDPIMSDVINELMLRTRHRYTVTSVIVTHDMGTAKKVPDRVVMLYPISRLAVDEQQIIFDSKPDRLDSARDRRVRQFVAGEAGPRLLELQSELN